MAGRRSPPGPSRRTRSSNRLSDAQPGTNPALHEAVRQGLRDLGYVEGRNVVIDTARCSCDFMSAVGCTVRA
jgi:hypothetical protein